MEEDGDLEGDNRDSSVDLEDGVLEDVRDLMVGSRRYLQLSDH